MNNALMFRDRRVSVRQLLSCSTNTPPVCKPSFNNRVNYNS